MDRQIKEIMKNEIRSVRYVVSEIYLRTQNLQ